MKQHKLFEESEVLVTEANKEVVNVASVPQRSPFRYPGGKTWLVPVVRKWLKQDKQTASHLIEPFVGGGIVGLTAAFENLANRVTLVEKDIEIAAVWQVMLSEKYSWLAERILQFDLSHENVKSELEREDKRVEDIAFNTILKNRTFHGGIIAKGSGLLKNGENGKGIFSRWYPKTLFNRINAIGLVKEKMNFIHGDAFEIISENSPKKDCYFFIDPPYTVAGKRLYTHFEIDHEELFRVTAKIAGRFMLTYDDTEYIRTLALKYGLDFRTIPMKTTHHLTKNEIIICDNFAWWD